MTVHGIGSLAAAGLAAATLLAATGCSAEGTRDATSVVINVDSDLAVGTTFDEITIAVKNPRGEKRFAFPVRSRAELPAVLGLLPAGDRAEAFEVTAAAKLAGVEVVGQSIRAAFVPGQASLVAMTLNEVCVGMVCASAEDTCDEGSCRPRQRTPIPWDGGAPARDGGVGTGGAGGAGEGGGAGAGGAMGSGGDGGAAFGTGGAGATFGTGGGPAPGTGGRFTGSGGNAPGTGGRFTGSGGNAPGSGGAAGTGGRAAGSGGTAPGTGGALGSGGAPGTGGTPGTGGAGTGGRGTGGTGTGGRGTGGAGTGGSGTGGAPSCGDGMRNGTESDVDCGGMCVPTTRCANGQMCGAAHTNCTSGYCNSGGICMTPSCFDAVHNGPETDVDCGGPCAKCALTKGCRVANDCISNLCLNMQCAPIGP